MSAVVWILRKVGDVCEVISNVLDDLGGWCVMRSNIIVEKLNRP